MTKILSTLLFSFVAFSCVNQPVSVKDRSSVILVEPGYSLMQTDSTFEFNHKKYLIKNREYFDANGSITSVALWKSEGYLVFKKSEFSKMYNFIEDHHFSNNISVNILDNHTILLNDQKVRIEAIDKRNKQLFYMLNNDPGSLYLIRYR